MTTTQKAAVSQTILTPETSTGSNDPAQALFDQGYAEGSSIGSRAAMDSSFDANGVMNRLVDAKVDEGLSPFLAQAYSRGLEKGFTQNTPQTAQFNSGYARMLQGQGQNSSIFGEEGPEMDMPEMGDLGGTESTDSLSSDPQLAELLESPQNVTEQSFVEVAQKLLADAQNGNLAGVANFISQVQDPGLNEALRSTVFGNLGSDPADIGPQAEEAYAEGKVGDTVAEALTGESSSAPSTSSTSTSPSTSSTATSPSTLATSTSPGTSSTGTTSQTQAMGPTTTEPSITEPTTASTTPATPTASPGTTAAPASTAASPTSVAQQELMAIETLLQVITAAISGDSSETSPTTTSSSESAESSTPTTSSSSSSPTTSSSSSSASSSAAAPSTATPGASAANPQAPISPVTSVTAQDPNLKQDYQKAVSLADEAYVNYEAAKNDPNATQQDVQNFADVAFAKMSRAYELASNAGVSYSQFQQDMSGGLSAALQKASTMQIKLASGQPLDMSTLNVNDLQGDLNDYLSNQTDLDAFTVGQVATDAPGTGNDGGNFGTTAFAPLRQAAVNFDRGRNPFVVNPQIQAVTALPGQQTSSASVEESAMEFDDV